MEDRLDTSVAGNRAQRRAATRGKKATALGSGLVLAAGAATTVATLASTAPAVANTPIVVDSLTDDGTGTTLREAIDQANTDAGQDTITFSVTGTITVTSDLPHITDALQIQGPGAAALTVDGADQWALLNFYDISSAAGVNEVSGITLTHGVADNTDGSGGGIVVRYGSADMTIANAVITDNYADNDGGGVQFYGAEGTVLITGTTISNNVADDNGGGLYADSGEGTLSITIVDSVITGNTARSGGGGGYFDNTSVTVQNSTVNFNTAQDAGGGLYVADGPFSMTGSWVGNNTSDAGGGGLYLYNTNAVIEFSTITGNESTDSGGGGVFFYDDGTDSTVTIRNSAITNNTAAYYGGGLYIDVTGQATIENSTISGNTSRQAGGVYGNYGGLTLTHVTITNNTATDPDNGIAVGGVQMVGGAVPQGVQARRAGKAEAKAADHAGDRKKGEAGAQNTRGDRVRAQAIGALDATGTIISGNGGQDVGVYEGAVDLNSDHSIIGVIDENVTVNDLGGSQLGVTDPGLEPLADNGGPTQTHALAVGSPAKDTGENPVATFPGNEFDQRGEGFARVVDGTVDVGAYEQQLPEPVVIAPKFTG